MKETALHKASSRAKADLTSATGQTDTASLVMIGSMGAVSALIGGGAVICFVAALLNAGPLAMTKGFLAAVGLV